MFLLRLFLALFGSSPSVAALEAGDCPCCEDPEECPLRP